MKKNGFTLVELLAVIVVLGVIMTIAGTAVMGQRRKANIEEAKNMEKTLADIGPDVYRRESMSDSSEFMEKYNDDEKFIISADQLKGAGYLSKTIENPAGGNPCDAYLLVDPLSTNEMFKGYINCEGLYATGQSGEDYNDDSYENVITDPLKSITVTLNTN